MGIAAAGLAAEIITCLIVPGWTGVSGIIKVTKVAGLVIIGTGVATAASAHVRMEEINRLVEQYQKEDAKEELYELISVAIVVLLSEVVAFCESSVRVSLFRGAFLFGCGLLGFFLAHFVKLLVKTK